MYILIDRKFRKETYTIGNLYINGTWFCNTLEDRDRLWRGEKKIHGKTAIPYGSYIVKFDYSPKFEMQMPYITGIIGFGGVMFHICNDEFETEGCICVGVNKAKGKVLESTKYFTDFYELLLAADKNNELIKVDIV